MSMARAEERSRRVWGDMVGVVGMTLYLVGYVGSFNFILSVIRTHWGFIYR